MDIKEFTYVVMSYKHKMYIIEHLSSIKYQITHYGEEWKNHLIFVDDASKDGTVELAKRWIEENRELFESVTIEENENNIGTVKNFIRILKMLKTRLFKLLSADDLYYANNIYEAALQDRLVITPTIRFENSKVLNETIWGNYRMLLGSRHLKWLLTEEFKECWIIETPGTFWDSLYLKEEAYARLEDFRYIEDVIFFHYLISETNIKVIYNSVPYIMYRMGGISTTKETSDQVKKYEEEVQKLEDEFFIRKKILSKGINIYRYYHGIKWRYYLYLAPVVRKKARDFIRSRYKEMRRAQEYLRMIEAESRTYKNEYQ